MFDLKRASRAAITLVELTLALALGAIVVVVALRAYYWAAENERVRQAISLVGFARESINSRFVSQPSYGILSNSLVVSAFPPSLIESGSSRIRDPFGGQLIVGPDMVSRPGDSNFIALTNLTSNACNKLSRADMGRDAAYIAIGGAGPVNKALALPLSQADQTTVDGQCKAAERTTVSWQFVPGSSSGGGGGGGGGGCSDSTCVPTIEVIQNAARNWKGSEIHRYYVATNTLFFMADTLHFSWASTDPGAPMEDAKSLILDAINFLTGDDEQNNHVITPADLGLAVGYLQYIALPARTSDTKIQQQLMSIVYSASSVMYNDAVAKGYPGFH